MDKVELSIKAKQLLDEGVMNGVFDALRKDIMEELLLTTPDESQKREQLFMVLQGLQRLELKFAWVCSERDFEDYQKNNLEANLRRIEC